jgi:hypothetical protein
MITNDTELQHSLDQLSRMYRALATLRSEIEPASPGRFALMAEGPLDEIRRLMEEIECYTGVLRAEEVEADVWLRVEGRNVAWPEAPTSVLTALLDAFRKGVQAVAEFLATGRLTTRPTKDIKRSCDLRVVSFRAGSLKIGMSLPDEAEPGLFPSEQDAVAHRALAQYLEVASWVASDAPLNDLEGNITDPGKRRLLLNALKPFVPRPRGDVQLVEISGRMAPQHRAIRLGREATQRIDQAIDRAVNEKSEEYEGDLREIDLDNLSFILRNIGDVQEVRCSFEEELLEAAKEALDRRVRVSGIRKIETGRRVSPSLRVIRLELLDDDDPTGRVEEPS